jgi:SAM-dependent methyltransferase
VIRGLLSLIASYRHRGQLQSARRFWNRQVTEEVGNAFWLAVPEIMKRVNQRVGGREDLWPLSWFLFSIKDLLPVNQALSLGCGVGSLEREVLRHQAALHIDAVDISEQSLQVANTLAAEQRYSHCIDYHLADLAQWLENAAQENRSYDLVFFHASLHHVEALEKVLKVVARLLRTSPLGLLYVDEYIGPSRNEWRWEHLTEADRLFARIPRQYRLFSKLRPPVAYGDLTEMIRSSDIEATLRQFFEVVDYRPYYGNVLMPLLSGIRKSALDCPQVGEVIREGIALEESLIARGGLKPLYAVFVARPRA